MKNSFYGPLRSQQYDIGTDTSEIVAFYLELWQKLGKPSPVLEPMVGTGLNLIPFLQAGADADGLDSSAHMLKQFHDKLNQLGLKCETYGQFLENMNLPRSYGFIMIPDGSFGHIYDQMMTIESLKRMKEHLLSGGYLVFDVRSLSFIENFGKPGEVDFDLDDYPDGSTVFTTGYWDHLEDSRVIRKWNKLERFVNDVLVQTEVFDYRERLYDLGELMHNLETIGFSEVRVIKAYEHDQIPTEKGGFVLICRK